MKTWFKTFVLTSLTVSALIGGMVQGKSQVVVGVDPAQTWHGWMNVSDLQGQNTWGAVWGLADLPAVFSGNALTVSPNVNTYNPTDPYWVNTDGSGNRRMEANVYIESSALGGNTVTFSGLTLAYTLAPGYYAQAFIKEFGPNYSWVGWDFQPLAAGTTFNVTRPIGAGNIIQYGIMTVGPNANPATVATLGYASVALVPEPASSLLLGFGLVAFGLCRRRS